MSRQTGSLLKGPRIEREKCTVSATDQHASTHGQFCSSCPELCAHAPTKPFQQPKP